MVHGTLLVACFAAITAGLAYAYLAQRLFHDGRAGSHASYLRSFAIWWATLAINILVVGATYLLAAVASVPFELQLGVSILQRLLLAIGVAALLRYLLYLRLGRDFGVALAIVYGGYTVLALAGLVLSRPDGVFVGSWRTELTYAAPLAWTRALSLLVVMPGIAACVAYFLLFFRVESAAMRYRIAVVSWALIGWWTLAVLAGQTAFLDVAWLQMVNRAASVVTALLVLAAHHPPRSLRARLAAWDARSEEIHG